MLDAHPRPATGRATFKEALARTAGVQKTAKGAPAYSRFVNRRLGRYLAAAAYAAGLSPNQVTVVSACFSYVSILLLAALHPSVLVAVAVTVGLLVGYAFDSADGQLARLRGGGSPVGEWLDHMVDCGKIALLHVAVFCSFYRFSAHSGEILALPLAFGVVSGTHFFGTILTDALRRERWREVGRPAIESAPLWRSLVVLPTDYGFLCLVFLTLAWHAVFVPLYAAFCVGSAGYLLLILVKWYREIGSFAAQSG